MPKKQNHEFKSLMIVFKRLLRERKISYAELAKKLGISESGVKKTFASEDGSYARLSQIANILGVKILDILEEIEQTSLVNVQLSKEQQAYFLKDPQLFSLYYKLVIERFPVDVAKRNLGFSDRLLFRYLKQLDELNLINLMPENKIKIPPIKMIRNFGSGPFLSKLYQDWGQTIVKDLADPQFQNTGHFIVRCLKMKDETYKEFLARLQELEIEFTRRGVREMNISMQNLKPLRWMSFTDQQSFIKD